MPRGIRVCVLVGLGIIAACMGDDVVAPAPLEVGGPAMGTVSWFCWVDSETGAVHSCDFWCTEEDDVLKLDQNGDLACEGPWEPSGGGDPPDPGTPGGGFPGDSITVTLTCDKGVVRGAASGGGCSISYPSSTPISNIQWSATYPDLNPAQSGGDSWSGIVADDVSVTVSFYIAGQGQKTLRDDITVSDRSWDWSTAWQYHKGAAPDCETSPHYSTTTLGWIRGLDCANPQVMFNPSPNATNSYSVQPINDGGPNDGMWYVAAPPLRMDLKSQILPDLRGLVQHPVGGGSPQAVTANCPSIANLPQVNTCASTTGNDFASMVLNVWQHERVHYDRAIVEAGMPQNDLWGILEREVAATQSDLLFKLVFKTTPINNAIFNASKTADSGSHGPYSFYALVGGSSGTWSWVTWTLQGALN